MGWEDNEDLMGPPWNWGSPAVEGQQLCAGAVNCRAGGLGLSTACAQTGTFLEPVPQRGPGPANEGPHPLTDLAFVVKYPSGSHPSRLP